MRIYLLALPVLGDLSCEYFESERLSTWQIVKKALWDRVRGAGLEISMQQGPLLQLALEVEGMDGAAADCPLGVFSLQLFMLDMLRALPRTEQKEEVTAWLVKLLFEAIELEWPLVLASGWPIFGLLRRLSTLATPQEPRVLWPTAEMPLETLQSRVKELFEVKSKQDLLLSFFHPASTEFWSRLSQQSQDYIFREALQSAISAPAEYFLRHLREFAGASGPIEPFLRGILSGSGSCWDVGAAPVPVKPGQSVEQDVWRICEDFGFETRAFEASAAGFQRLLDLGTSLGSRAGKRQLALSNYTGPARFNRGGQVTGSLGHRGCGSAGRLALSPRNRLLEAVSRLLK